LYYRYSGDGFLYFLAVRIQVLKAEDCPTGSIKVDTERMKRRETFQPRGDIYSESCLVLGRTAVM